MNFLPIILAALAVFGLNKKEENKKSAFDFGKIFEGGGIGNLLQVMKLFDKNASQEDRTGAMMEILSNPMVFDTIKNIFFSQNGKSEKQPAPSPPSFSEESKRTFEPIEDVAGVKISEKLCHLYDNWYISK